MPRREIEIGTETKPPDLYLLNIVEATQLSDDLLKAVDEQSVNQPETHGF